METVDPKELHHNGSDIDEFARSHELDTNRISRLKNGNFRHY